MQKMITSGSLTSKMFRSVCYRPLLVRCYTNGIGEEVCSITRGKKIKPTKPNIVVLNPKQAGLLNDSRRYNISSNEEDSIVGLNRLSKGNNSISILEGVDLDFEPSNKRATISDTEADLINDTKRLLKFTSKVTFEQTLQSIESQRPDSKILSSKQYLELEERLLESYTAKQLQAYLKDKKPELPCSKWVKKKLISEILKSWNCSLSDTPTNIQHKVIKLSRRDAKLLLLTQNGKILKNLTRINRDLMIQLNLSQNELKISGQKGILKFIEISLTNILNNVRESHWNFPNVSPNIIPVITRICGVDINIESESIAAFGWKRIDLAKRLINWYKSETSISKNHTTEKLTSWISPLSDASNIRLFPFSDMDCLDWINRTSSWGRSQEIAAITTAHNVKKIDPIKLVSEDKINTLYQFLQNSKNDTKNPTEKNLSITLGQILRTIGEEKHIFQPKISHITSKLLKLPLYDEYSGKDEYFALDQHDYYLQLKLSPAASESSLNPLEIWLELDDNGRIILDSAHCIEHLSRKDYLIATPELSHDFKICLDEINNITLENVVQPGLKEFLDNLKFPSLNAFKAPKQLIINLPNAPNSVYDYLHVNQHRVLRLKYLGKYSVQFSEVDGGSLGGRYTQIDFIGNGMITREQFGQFVRDIFSFS